MCYPQLPGSNDRLANEQNKMMPFDLFVCGAYRNNELVCVIVSFVGDIREMIHYPLHQIAEEANAIL